MKRSSTKGRINKGDGGGKVLVKVKEALNAIKQKNALCLEVLSVRLFSTFCLLAWSSLEFLKEGTLFCLFFPA